MLNQIIKYCNVKNLNIFSTVLFLILVALYLGTRIAIILSTNIEIFPGESNNVWNILNAINGRALYVNPEQAPYEIFQYTPISQLLNIYVIKASNVSDYLTIYKIIRVLNLIINVALSFYIFKVFRSILMLKFTPALWLSFLSLLILTPQNWIIRPDALSISISLLAIALSCIGIIQKKHVYIYYSGIATSIALFTKQDAIQLLAIIPIALFLIQEYSYIFKYLISSIVAGIILFLLFYLYYGSVFTHSIIGGVNNGISIFNGFNTINRYFQIYSLYPIAIIILACYSIIKNTNKTSVYISLLAVGTFIFACVTSLKYGSWINYFTLFNLVGILLLGVWAQTISSQIIYKGIYLFFAYYFFLGIIYHYAIPAIQFDTKEYNETKNISEKLQKTLNPNESIFVTNNYLKLHLFNTTILPNQEFYPVSAFEFRDITTIKKNLIIVTKALEMNHTMVNTLKIDIDSLHKIGMISSYTMYKYGGTN